jgi:hypothetical protein
MTKIYISLALFALCSSKAMALIGGVTSSVYPEVVKIEAGRKVCTGTIIGPRTILSAAHCVTQKSEGAHIRYLGKVYPVSFISSASSARGHDIALAITNVDIKGARFARLGRGLAHGISVIMAGFGCTKKGGKPGALHIGKSKVIGMDEDHILSASPGGSVLCEGDSGGPTFVDEDGGRRLVAVSSLSDISKININVRTDSDMSYTFFKTAAAAQRIQICGINSACN